MVECKPSGLRGYRRTYAQTLVERAVWLPPADRALVEAVYAHGLSVAAYVRRCREAQTDPLSTEIAENPTGGSHAEGVTRIARRRLRRLVERLVSNRFAFVTARRNTWPATRRRIAVTCVVQGRSMREASRELGLSLHTVRRHMQAVEALFSEHAESARVARESVRAVARQAARDSQRDARSGRDEHRDGRWAR